MLHVGRWKTFVSVFPIKTSELDVPPEELPEDELPDEEPPELVPPEITPDPEPVLSVPPPGKVRVAPFVENTTLPFLSVRYTETPAEESLLSVALVG